MATPEQLVDALIEEALQYGYLYGERPPKEEQNTVNAARADVLAAMGGQPKAGAVPVAWQRRRIGEPWPEYFADWQRSLSPNFDDGLDPAFYEQRALYVSPPAPSAMPAALAALRLGSMVEESGGGKYEIRISYRTIDDMFAAAKALVALRAV